MVTKFWRTIRVALICLVVVLIKLLMVSALFISASFPPNYPSSRKVVNESLKVLKKVQLLHSTERPSFVAPLSPTWSLVSIGQSRWWREMVPDLPRCSCLIHRLNSSFAWVGLPGSIFLDSSAGRYTNNTRQSGDPRVLSSDSSSYIVSQQPACVKIDLPFRRTSNLHYARSYSPSFSLGSSNSPTHLDPFWMAAHN